MPELDVIGPLLREHLISYYATQMVLTGGVGALDARDAAAELVDNSDLGALLAVEAVVGDGGA
ncbi:hypothetical protein FAF44_02850 [Nonomuraea sp. MG754425]|uniref:hypothetical protein n=1 Tax=Nonomuraea sp. MG754425 TaxID=2570319 RepID=UPI001F1BEE75|nr:hypothetical protein [Nonomuraea sp. MG754425]MCF6467353.1 hypothetical protein [Nonomuraea sp. MG754425]